MMPNQSPVGVLCHGLPKYVTKPPIEAVVFAWGVNEDGQLGLDDKQNVATPKVVEAFLGMRLAGRSFYRTPIVTGSRNTLAIDVDGQVWSWGWNERATLGLGHQMPVSKPQRLAALAGVHVIQVAVNGWHCLALSEQGQVFAWGGNEYFQCGVDREKRDIVLPTPCLPGLKVRQVACGGMHSLALTEEGTVWTWGEPWGDFSLNVERQPRPVPGAVNMASIAAGAFHNMALSYEGQVFTWGTNDYGQLGNGHTTYDTQPTPVLDMEGVLVSDIAAGGWHSLAITIHGEVYAWGRGEYGRLGIGDPTGSSKLRPCKVRALEGHRIVQVAAGGTHTMAVSIEGRMWSWGRSSFGRLGLGNGIGKEDIYSPIEVTLPGGPGRWNVCALACGGRHSICLALPLHNRLVGGSSVTSESEMISEEVDGVSEASLFCRDVVLGGGEASNGSHAASGPINTYSFHNGSGGFNTSAFNTGAPGNQSTFAGAGDNASIAAASRVARMGSAASASTATTGGRSSAAQILMLSGPSGEGDVGLPPLELPMPPDSATDGAASTPAMVILPGMGSSSGAAKTLSGQATPPSTAGSPSKPLPPATPAPAAPAAAPASTAPVMDTTPAEQRLPVMPLPSEVGGTGSGMAAAAAAALAAPPCGQLVVSPDTTPLHMNPVAVPAPPVGGSLLKVTSASAPVTPIGSGPSMDLDALPSIELQVGLKPTHEQRLSVDVSGPARSASSNLGVVTALSSVGSGTTPDGTALAASSALYTMPPTINTTISGGWSQGLAQGGSSSPRPRSAGSRGSSRRQQSGNVSSPTRAGGVGAGRTFAAAVSPTHKDVLVHQMSGGFGRENSVGVTSDGQDKEWAVVEEEEEEEAAVAPGAAALAVWPGKGTDMHTLVDMTLESEDMGEQRKAAAKARRRAARNDHLHTRNHSFDSSQAIASGSYQPPHPMLEGDSSSPTDREEEPGDDEDDHALSAHSGPSRVSYHAMHPDGLDVRTVPRPVSPSHAYLGRNLGFVPPGSPVGAAQLQASLMSPVRLSGSPHEQVVVDVAARLAAAVVGSPRNSNFTAPMTFNEILAIPRSISPLPVAGSLYNPPPTPASRTASAASAPSATAAAANASGNSWRSSSGTVPIAVGGLQPVHSGGSGGAVDAPPPAERGRSMPTIAKSPRAGARRRAGGNSGGGLAIGSSVALGDSGSQSGTPAAGISPQGSLPHPSSLGGGTDEDEIHDALMASLSRPMAV